MKILLKIILLATILQGQLYAHSGKPRFHVIIDTDGALDDMRSISMLLAGNDIRVLAITCSQGTLLPDSVYVKVRSLLSIFHHEGIPLGISNTIDRELPVWSSFAQNIDWGQPVDSKRLNLKTNSTELLHRVITDYREKITLIALGSLKTYADWIRTYPELITKIERIVWYNNLNIESGFNYKVSPESYEFIKQAGVLLDIISNNSDLFFINNDYLEHIGKASSIYARQIGLVHSQPEVLERIRQQHIQLWDDLIPLYLEAPILFETEMTDNTRRVSITRHLSSGMVVKAIVTLLESASATNNRVFREFPIDSTLYKPEYAGIISSTIDDFGLIEWKAISMTNEIHGHTGIYSIIGAKMGVRAMEFFNVGVNNLEVITFAGNKPPLSCFNDGIQISTGATIGQGLITISDSISSIPSAIFEFNNRRVSISLKPEIAAQMQKEIQYGVQNYGLLSNQYWLYIEKLAIRYWSTFDRYKIFNLEF